eukprot:6264641-Karenia_brevis.AAC.1
MTSVVKQAVGEGMDAVTKKLDEMKSEMEDVKAHALRAGETASAAMESVRALKADMDKRIEELKES